VTAPEFSRPVRVDTLGEGPRVLAIEAEEGERRALAARFGLVSLESLEAELALVRKGAEVNARGRLRAEVVQSCVASGAPVRARIDEPFEILFRPHPRPDRPEEEVELSETELDVVFYDGAAVDVGEAAAESLLLSLDPYPRAPEAQEALKSAGVKSEEEAGPFGALASLRDKLTK
jgi:uncharacterized metal-binding protein YceD (DUF177 family)